MSRYTPPCPIVRCLAFLLAVLSVAVTAQPADRVARLDSALAALHADGLFDGALAISGADGTVLYRFAAGMHDGAPVTTDRPLYVASVSKQMTAAAVLSLVAERRLGTHAVAAGLSYMGYDGDAVTADTALWRGSGAAAVRTASGGETRLLGIFAEDAVPDNEEEYIALNYDFDYPS